MVLSSAPSLGQVLVMHMATFSIWFKFSQVSDPGPSWPSCLWMQSQKLSGQPSFITVLFQGASGIKKIGQCLHVNLSVFLYLSPTGVFTLLTRFLVYNFLFIVIRCGCPKVIALSVRHSSCCSVNLLCPLSYYFLQKFTKFYELNSFELYKCDVIC